MTISVLHISHSDISQDSRILKELKSLKNNFKKYNFIAIGIKNKIFNIKKKKNLKINIIYTKLLQIIFFLIPKFLWHIFKYFGLVFKCLKIIKNSRPTIIHCHDFISFTVGILIKKIYPTKLVYDAHELECLEKLGKITFKQRSKIIFFFEKFFWKDIDLFITVSPSILKWYTKNYGNKENSIVVLNSPEISLFKPRSQNQTSIGQINLHDKLNISKNKLIFVYVGYFQQGRGINLMLETFSKNINSHIVFVGKGPLEKKIREFTLNYNNIHICKPVPHDVLVKFISSADVGLCLIEKLSLSDFYCLPNKFFEFAFANLYILASNFPDMKRLIMRYSLGKCISLNINTLIKEIKFLENNKKKSKVLKKNLADLAWHAQSQKLVRGYENILLKS